MFYDHSIIYAIILKDPIDEFEVVPDIMKALRCKLSYTNIIPREGQGPNHTDFSHDVWSYGFKIASDCDERLLRSKFYADNKSTWLNNDIMYKPVSTDLTKDIALTEAEERLRSTLLGHPMIKENVLHDGWVEIANHY